MHNNQLPLVSIIVPTYNQADFLRECIKSVLAQSYQNWEMIIVNNFSTDNTSEVVQSYLNDGRISYFEFKNDGVIARSRNYAIGKAKGDWLAFLDSDDLWSPDKLQISMDTIVRKKVDAICHGEVWVYDNGQRTPKIYGREFSSTFSSMLLSGNRVSTSAVVVSRRHVLDVGGFTDDPQMITAEDFHLWLKLMKSGVRFYFIAELLGEYRVHPAGNSQSVERNTSAICKVVESFLTESKGTTVLSKLEYRKARAVPLYAAARSLQVNGQYAASFKYLYASMMLYPFNWKNFVVAGLNLIGYLGLGSRASH